MQEHHTSRPHLTHYPLTDYRSRGVIPIFGGLVSPAGLSQAERRSHATNSVVGHSVRRTKYVWPGNARFRDGLVGNAKFSCYLSFAALGEDGMGVGVVLYRVSFVVFSAYQPRILSGLFSDDEEGCRHPEFAQDV